MARPIPDPHWTLPVLLVACTWVSVLSTDLYAPSLPHLPARLGTTERAAKMTMAANLVAFALAQLVHGPLADRFGRRRLLVTGLGGFAAASSLCALAPSIEVLIAGRFLQGLLSSVPSVVVLLVIHELYGGRRGVRVLGFHGMAVSGAPILGPLIGGAVFVAFGWRMNFWLLAAFAAMITTAICFRLPETLTRPTSLGFREILSSYARLLRRRQVLAHLLPAAAVFGALFAFVTAGPFVFIDHYRVATDDYGYYFGAVIVASILGGLAANRLGGRVPTARIEAAAYAFSLLGVGLLGALAVSGWDDVCSVTVALSVFGVGLGLMNASAPILILENAGDLPKSSAAAVAGSSQLVAASAASFAVAALEIPPLWSMTAVMCGLLCAGGIGILLAGDSEKLPGSG